MAIDVRTIREDELVSWLDAQTTGFLVRPEIDKIAEEVREHWDLSRIWGALDGDRVVGTLRTYGTELTVPGNRGVKASAVTQVAVRPTHRRRGLLRRMVTAEHAAARDRGEVASMLYASEGSIYGRFGYGIACQTAAWMIDVRSTRIHEAAGGRAGSIEVVDTDESAVDVARRIYEGTRRQQPGEIWRRPITWKSDFGLAGRAWGESWKGFLAIHRGDDGTADGYARYHADPKWEHRQPQSTLIVDDLHAATPDAEVALLRFLVDVDLVTTLRIEGRTPTDRLPWLLTNPRAARLDDVGDGLWVMLHDVAGALVARTYERAGSVVLEISGTEPDAEGRTRIALDAGPDGASADETDRPADLTIHASALGAVYLGGTRLRNAVLATGADEHRAGALDEADALFGTRDAPWCSTFF
ncbi:MAG TPA: GNAT family N-acetyltransferase [Candidatus Limnocylindrales bacterium]|nr:GNAT family N-acetyltransferase [Candidatus Limnocylindrales bacterium]